MATFNLGEISSGFINPSGILDSFDPVDTYNFSLPSLSGTAFEEIDNAGFIFTVTSDLIDTEDEVTISTRTATGELIGTITLSPGDTVFSDIFIASSADSSEEAFNILLEAGELLEPGEDFVVEIETTNPALNPNPYDIEVEFAGLGSGEITTNDKSYCCGDDEDNKYYYDELSGVIEAGQNGVVAGEVLEFVVTSEDFEPVFFVLNDDTREVIDIALSEILTVENLGSTNAATLSFIVEEDISYSLSIETTEARETGEYFIAEIV